MNYDEMKAGNVVSFGSKADTHDFEKTPKEWIVVDVNRDKQTFTVKEARPDEVELVFDAAESGAFKLVSCEGWWMREFHLRHEALADLENARKKLRLDDAEGAFGWVQSAINRLSSIEGAS